jgi:acetyl/propionyl-CoA carboxylase alpha subunit
MRTLLIANRGEIACRIARSAQALGLRTVAVFTEVDAHALHVRSCDEAVALGPANAYLDGARLLQVARQVGADAIHPGYGFLSERADFAEAVLAEGLVWVGPPPAVMRALGRKDLAKETAAGLGVPVVPGTAPMAELTVEAAASVGFPLLLKAVAGGGGRGMRVVRTAAELPDALALAAREAKESFGDATLLAERWIEHGRHIEVQVLADGHGRVLHLGERECSVQRRHQKIIEESPAPGLAEATRAALCEAAVKLAAGVGYQSAGTVEFLLDADTGAFYFLEVNTRIQVEHPVTELRTGLDLVAWQLRVAAGQPLDLAQADVRWQGHAIEARLCAEDPRRGWQPQAGDVLRWTPPSGPGLRVDHGLGEQAHVPVHYDAMVAKVLAHGSDRGQALDRLAAALADTVLLGLAHNIPTLKQILSSEAFRAGQVTTRWLEQQPPPGAREVDDATLVAAAVWRHGLGVARRFRNVPNRPDVTVFEEVHVALQPVTAGVLRWGVSRSPDPLLWRIPALTGALRVVERTPQRLVLELDGRRLTWHVADEGVALWLQPAGSEPVRLVEGSLLPEPMLAAAAAGSVCAPGPALVVEVHVVEGQEVEVDTPLVTLEAMKMLTVLRAPVAGQVRAVLVAAGQPVAAGAAVVELTGEQARNPAAGPT